MVPSTNPSKVLEVVCATTESEDLSNELFEEFSKYLREVKWQKYIEENPSQTNCIVIDNYFLSIDWERGVVLGNDKGKKYIFEGFSSVNSIGLLTDYCLLVVQNNENTEYYSLNLLTGQKQQLFENKYQKGDNYELSSQRIIALNGKLFLEEYSIDDSYDGEYFGLSDPLKRYNFYEYSDNSFVKRLSAAGDVFVIEKYIYFVDSDFNIMRFDFANSKTEIIDNSKIPAKYKSTAIYGEKYMVGSNAENERICIDLITGNTVKFDENDGSIFLVNINIGDAKYYAFDYDNDSICTIDLSTGKMETVLRFLQADEIVSVTCYQNGLLINIGLYEETKSENQFFYYDGMSIKRVG